MHAFKSPTDAYERGMPSSDQAARQRMSPANLHGSTLRIRIHVTSILESRGSLEALVDLQQHPVDTLVDTPLVQCGLVLKGRCVSHSADIPSVLDVLLARHLRGLLRGTVEKPHG